MARYCNGGAARLTKGEHHYQVRVEWQGNHGTGTSDYRAYGREHVISAPGKPDIPGSADPAFRGDASRWNPEDLLLASLSSCHKLWYLHLCAMNGIRVLAYVDQADAVMIEDANGTGRFVSAVLHPVVTIGTGDDAAVARQLHHTAHQKCFIANSVNFPVTCEAEIDQ